MKKLYLITTGFPYPAKSMETYLETESQYYGDFEEVNIISLGVKKNTLSEKRDVDCKSKLNVFPVVFGTKLEYIFNGITALFDFNFYKEVGYLIKNKRFTIRRLIRLIIYISRSHFDANRAVKTLKLDENHRIKDAVIYCYRFEYQPYVALLLKKYFEKPTMVARAHGYDLYEERNSDQYIPARKILLEEYDRVYLISEDGCSYLSEKYPYYRDKLGISRLGTKDYGITDCGNADGVFRIVSCSNMVRVKRIDRIISALSKINSLNVEWIHFGSGEEEDTLTNLAANLLGGKIKFEFKGRVDNKVILDYYQKNPVHLFINLSESEGIPVSIMEAMSFGIPCVATNVGGTAEIVEDRTNGRLVNSEDDEFIAMIIDELINMSPDKYNQCRIAARNMWEKKYCASDNYSSFVHEIMNLKGAQ